MDRKKKLFLVAAATALLVSLVAGGFLAGRMSGQGGEGRQPYSPTKLEWLALELNARNPFPQPAFDNVEIYFKAGHFTESILVIYRHPEDEPLDPIFLEGARIVADSVITSLAREKGWLGWVKIRHEKSPYRYHKID